MKRAIIGNIRLMILAAIFSLGLGVAFAANWTGPGVGVTAPQSNVFAPINLGSLAQVKAGGLWVGSLGIDNSLTLGAGGIKFTDGTIQTTAPSSNVKQYVTNTCVASGSGCSITLGSSGLLSINKTTTYSASCQVNTSGYYYTGIGEQQAYQSSYDTVQIQCTVNNTPIN